MAEHNQQFGSFTEWVNKASSWLTRRPKYHKDFFKVICFDTLGRRCQIGEHFMRARDEKTFPIRWWWPDQPISELSVSPDVSERIENE